MYLQDVARNNILLQSIICFHRVFYTEYDFQFTYISPTHIHVSRNIRAFVGTEIVSMHWHYINTQVEFVPICHALLMRQDCVPEFNLEEYLMTSAGLDEQSEIALGTHFRRYVYNSNQLRIFFRRSEIRFAAVWMVQIELDFKGSIEMYAIIRKLF